MVSQIFLIAWILWTHSQGWTDPIEVIDHWGLPQYKDLCVTPGDHIHQLWYPFENTARIGYNIVLEDGSLLLVDQMVSNDVNACYPQMASLGEDSVVMVWQESSYFWFQVRDGDGDIVTPTTQFPVPPSSRIRYDVDCDSLKRIHLVCAQIESTNNEFVLYTIHDINGTLLFTDTLPDHSYYDPSIHIDGNRVHIKYESDNPWRTMYIQYDLEGNITVSPVLLFDDDNHTAHFSSLQSDWLGHPYVLIWKQSVTDPFLALYKLDKETGDKLIDGITIGQGVTGCSIDNYIPVFESMPGDTSFYAAWLRGDWYVDFCIINQDGDFIEEPYTAYDYSDEDIQHVQYLRGAVNEEGNCFLTWSEGDTLVWGYYIVLGILDFDWVGLSEDTSSGLLDLPDFMVQSSENPFCESVEFTVSGLVAGGELDIYDILGRKLVTINSSNSVFLWDGLTSSGEPVASGTYFVMCDNGIERSILKLVKIE